MTASYEDVLEYQNSQLRSLGTAGKSVTPKTANRRADEVTHFLRWASLNGLRPSFHYETKTVDRIINGRRRTFLIRLGRSREALYEDDPTHFPTAAQIAAWLKSVLTIRGEAKWLACRFVLETGARKSEVSNLKVSDWPSDERIAKAIQQNSAFVHMTLKHGTKGGRPRQIRVPLAFAMQVQAWRKKRNTYAYRYYKRTGRRIDLMFLSDSGMHAGTPLSGQTIWRCFREVEPRPDRWTTHKGRHAYAVFLVLYALESEAQASHSSLKTKGPEWIYDRGRHWLMLLKKQFGHISEETTQIYLRWLVATAGISDYAAGWHRYLNDEAGE
ncbi:tyrosine-type recombinase/integrase [Tardiphaga sp. 20_F10_N6_6]|uniref:tyrosine-type recombinase/integrase n=1 Tax=Tardiphaga sp. 20_F10_N6_6 TaxID=3240788 RepID=UPI003F8C58CD